MFTAFKTIFNNNEHKIYDIDISLIRPNPYGLRKSFNNDALCALALSIKQYGVFQPITVRKDGELFELVSGERRLRASKLAGMTTIPCILIDANDNKTALFSLLENLQCEELCFFEEAQGYSSLMSRYDISAKELGKRLGKTLSEVENKLELLNLSDKVRDLVCENALTEKHAKALLALENEFLQIDVINQICTKHLNVEQTKALIDGIKQEYKPKPYVNIPGAVIKDIRIFTNTIRQALEIMKNNGLKTHMVQKEFDWGVEYTIKVKNI